MGCGLKRRGRQHSLCGNWRCLPHPKGQDKAVAPRKLTYEHDMSQVMKSRQPKRQLHEDEKELQAACKIRNFISQTPWCQSKEHTEEGRPGITWLELYILYKNHEEKPETVTFLEKKSTLQTDLDYFKQICRNIAGTCVCEENEWIFDTCYSQANRLARAGVTNKHAGIKGMPCLSEKEQVVTM